MVEKLHCDYCDKEMTKGTLLRIENIINYDAGSMQMSGIREGHVCEICSVEVPLALLLEKIKKG